MSKNLPVGSDASAGGNVTGLMSAARLVFCTVEPARGGAAILLADKAMRGASGHPGLARELTHRARADLARARAMLTDGPGIVVSALGDRCVLMGEACVVARADIAVGAIDGVLRALDRPLADLASVVPILDAALRDYLDHVEARFLAAHRDVKTRQKAGIVRSIGEMRTVSAKVAMISINASIEAARCGRDGAAFAVIAGEVRALAQEMGAVSSSLEARLTRR